MRIEARNTFEKGWVTNVDKEVQPDGTVYFLLNMRIKSNAGNSYAAENIIGNKVSFRLNPNYQPTFMKECGNRLYVWSHNFVNPLVENNGEIGYVEIDMVTGEGTYIPLYNYTINFSREFAIEGEIVPENSDTERIYWWDNNNQPRSMNTLNPIFNTYIDNSSLVVGKKYMVIQGSVDYNGTDYGPNENANTVFEAITGITTYTDNNIHGYSALVIEYYDKSLLDLSPGFLFNIPLYKSVISGNCYNGMYITSYQLETLDGKTTNWSPTSEPVHLTSGNIGTSVQSWQDYAGRGAGNPNRADINTGSGLRFTINNIDRKYFKIRVCFIHFTEDHVESNPIVFSETTINADSMDFDIIDNIGLEEILLEDIADSSIVFLKNKAGSIVDRTLWLSNVTLSSELNIEFTQTTIRPKFERYLGDFVGWNIGARVNQSNTEPIWGNAFLPEIDGSAIIPANFRVRAYQWYYISGDPTAPTAFVTYNGQNYQSGDYFQGIPLVQFVTSIVLATGETIKPVLLFNSYGNTKKHIDITNDSADHKGHAFNAYKRSYWRNEEVYRIGILLWKNGNPTYVYHLKDWQTPKTIDIEDEYGNTINAKTQDAFIGPTSSDPSGTWLQHLGMIISNLDFNLIADALEITLAELPLYFDGFSIVRAERDEKIAMQGMLWPIIVDLTNNPGTPNRANPLALNVTYGHQINADTSVADNELWSNAALLIAPEQMIYFGAKNYEVLDGDKVKVIGFVDEAIDNGSSSQTIKTTPFVDPFDLHSIFTQDIVLPNASYPNVANPYGEVNVSKANTIDIDIGYNTRTVGPDAVEYEHKAEFNSIFVPFSFRPAAVPHRMRLIYTNDNLAEFFNILNSDIQAQNIVNNETLRPIVNYMRNKGVLYGGTTAEAKSTTEYILCGHYQSFDSNFMDYLQGTTESYDAIQSNRLYLVGDIITQGSTNYYCILSFITGGSPTNPASDATHWVSFSSTTKEAGIVNNIEVWGGDCYLNIVDINRCMRNEDETISFSHTITFCIESNVNFGLREGKTVGRVKIWNGSNPNGIGIGSGTSNTVEALSLNNVYNNENTTFKFPAFPIFSSSVNEYKRRSYYSEEKRDGEKIDSFTKFKEANYIEVDNDGGEITSTRKSKDNQRLYVFQQYKIAIISVNERAIIPNSLGQSLTLGDGVKADRYDNIDSYYGLQHKFALVDCPNGWKGTDAIKRVDWFLPDSSKILQASELNELSNIIYKVFSETNIPDFPLLNQGIYGVYDNKFKEAIVSVNNEVRLLTYALQVLKMYYSGSYSFTPCIYGKFHDYILSGVFKPETLVLGANSQAEYNVGEEVIEVNIQTGIIEYYICVAPYTIDPLVIPMLKPSQLPDYFVKTSDTNDVFIHNFGAFNKFYGIVEDLLIEIIVNKNPEETKYFDNFEFNQGEVFWSSLDTSTEDQIGSDAINTQKNDDYIRFGNKWFSSVPLDTLTGQRMEGTYLYVTLVKNMKLNGNPTESINEILRLRELKTIMTKSY